MKRIFFVTLSLMIISILKAQTPIFGTWTNNIPITSNCYVPAGQTLTIQSGATVTFMGQYSIRVKGTLNATGTSANPVIFTANNQGSGWRGIRFINYTSGVTSSFTYCVFEYCNKSDSCVSTPPTYTYPTNIVNSGGAIYMHNASSNVSFSYCEFSNNLVCARGGAMLCSNSSPSISNSTFYNNVAYYHGGAICCQNSSAPIIQTSDIYLNNSHQGGGGGIWIEDESDPTVDDNDIYENTIGNTSTAYGGGIGISDDSDPSITENDIYDNYVFTTSSGGGGGIFIEDSKPYINLNNIEINYSEGNGGGILIGSGANTGYYISNNSIANNYSKASGGGFYCYYSKPFFNNNTVSGNTAKSNGGGLFIEEAAMICLDNHIYNNDATDFNGGGIYCKNAHVTFNNSSNYGNKISSNTAGNYGGGAYLFGSCVTFNKISFYDNSAKNGGAVYCYTEAPRFLNIQGDYGISYNSATYDGGAIYMEGCDYNSSMSRDPLIGSCEISENDAGDDGAGVYINGGYAHLVNALIHNNEADGDGGAMYGEDADPEFYNCTVALNHAVNDYDGIYLDNDCDPMFYNTIVYFHGDYDIYYNGYPTDQSNVKYFYCDFEQWANGSPFTPGNISSDPIFVDQSNGDFRISGSGSSPCIDEGYDNFIYPASSYDIRGFYRTVNVAGFGSSEEVDIGAYEFEEITAPFSYKLMDTNLVSSSDLGSILEVYPIPAKDFVFLRLQTEESGKLQIRIFNVTGKVVEVIDYNLIEGENNIIIQRNGLPSGTYYMQLNSDKIANEKPVKILFN